ncbi:MAG: hypothetical protein N2109_02250 [Fimbriimonadales bacterium]|nr:hypothetical protein [Fimbriimonadales bacterium]
MPPKARGGNSDSHGVASERVAAAVTMDSAGCWEQIAALAREAQVLSDRFAGLVDAAVDGDVAAERLAQEASGQATVVAETIQSIAALAQENAASAQRAPRPKR